MPVKPNKLKWNVKVPLSYGLWWALLGLILLACIFFEMYQQGSLFFRLERPWLIVLLLIPLLLFYFSFSEYLQLKFHFSNIKIIQQQMSRWLKLKFYLPKALQHFAIFLCFLALAGPQLGSRQTELETQGIDIMLVLDSSGSMDALDFELGGKTVNRLTVVKKVVMEFIKNRIADRIGLISFGDMAYTQSPLTLDYEVLNQFVQKLDVGVAGEGTAIGDGLALGVKRLKDSIAKSRIIILLTDGRSNSGSIPPMKAAELAKNFGIKVYTVGVGSNAGIVPIRRPGLYGDTIVRVRADLDEETLQQIASLTQGEYFNATDSAKLKQIYDTIDKMEKTVVKAHHYERYSDLFPLLISLALICLLLQTFLQTYFIKQVEV